MHSLFFPKRHQNASVFFTLLSAVLALLLSSGQATAADNLAAGKKATQSSTYNNIALAARAVDGNTDGRWRSKSVSHTRLDNSPWWQVDLEQNASIEKIEIYNRTDCCANRLRNFYVLVSDAPFASNDLAALLKDAAVWHQHHAATAGQLTTFNLNRSGRYVRIQLANRNYLQLAEVKVLGTDSSAENIPSGNIVAAQLSGKCVDIAGASQAENATVLQYNCHSGKHQNFSFKAVGDAYQVIASHSGKCLGVAGASTQREAFVVQMSCNGAAHQLWQISGVGSDRLLKAKHTNMCLNVQYGSKANGAKLIQWPCSGGANEKWQLPSSHAQSSWAGPYTMPLVAASAANLPDGRVLTWSAYSKVTFGGSRGSTYTAIFDPATGQSTEALISNTGHDMFCPGISQLADGSIMVTGGSNAGATSIYNPVSNQWSKGPALNTSRGYHSQTTMGDGSVFTVGGSWSGGVSYKDAELWGPNTQAWAAKPQAFAATLLTDDARDTYRADNHMWLQQAPNGLVFHAGPAKAMHWIDPANQGAVYYERDRGNADAMNGNSVMYDIGKILTLGGAPDYDNSAATKKAHIVDINGGRGKVTVQEVSEMHFARAFHNSVVLPSGEVVVVGGQKVAIPFSDADSALDAEIWSPKTGEFSLLAPMTNPRNYHSFALLLQDGRVIAGGSGLCGGCATNHPDAEILSPPYLFDSNGNAAVRPVIDNAPSSASHGQQITVLMNSNTAHDFVLVRTGSATHSVNTDQRRVPIASRSLGGGQFSISIPANASVAVPGNYFLFALNKSGVPSVAHLVNIQ